MPVVIGAKPESSFQDPIGLLTDCHRRIERFLSVLKQLSDRAQGRNLTSGERQALETALTYFRVSAPKHTADEEESLFPRLQHSSVLTQIESLQREHLEADRMHAEIDRVGQKWLASEALEPDEATRFSALVNELANLYARHIEVEERDLFPVARAVLETAQSEAIGAEMSARRALSLIR